MADSPAAATQPSSLPVQPRLADAASHIRFALASAAAALARGDFEAAFVLADRVCRMPVRRQTGMLLLRAEAAYRLGRKAEAISDVDDALTIDPDDAEALNRRMLWSAPADAMAAAHRIIKRPGATSAVAHALTRLRGTFASVASARICDGRIEGWIAWQGSDPIRADIDFGGGEHQTSLIVAADPQHPLAAALGSAARLAVQASNASGLWFGSATGRGGLALKQTPGSMRFEAPKPAVDWRGVNPEIDGPAPQRAAALTVIVPVYLDVDATRLCLESLVGGAAGQRGYDVILVDDASPDLDIKSLLSASPFRVLTNASNMGFARSVNRALAEAPAGDVVLLNADAVLPPGALDRLSDAAYSAADIGTVTPLSNNGELVSVPRPYEVNPMPAREDAVLIDRAVQQADAPHVIDLPCGIGFCLFVRHDCRAAIGELSQDYDRGYGEDVDLCLRAREFGFRSVCAANVYVAHAGTRSFRADKRALVVRNLRRMEARFPAHRPETVAFRAADPLREVRYAVLNAVRPETPAALILATAATRAQAERRCAQRSTDAAALLAVLEMTGAITLWRCCESEPPIAIGEAETLQNLLGAMTIARIEICDPALLTDKQIALPDAPVDLYVCGRGPYDSDRSPNADKGSADRERRLWTNALAASQRRTAADADAALFCRSVLGVAADEIAFPHDRPAKSASPNASPGARRFGIVPIGNAGFAPELITTLARQIVNADARHGRTTPRWPVVVLGPTLWDKILMASGLVHVTGTIAANDMAAACAQHQIARLWLASALPAFGHPLQSAVCAGPLPLAKTAWGQHAERNPDDRGDFAIDAGLSGKALAEALATWHENGDRRISKDADA